MTQATDTHAELMALAKEASIKKAKALKLACGYSYDRAAELSAARWDGMAKAYRKAAAMLKAAQDGGK
jgi:hypothetical protein